MEGGLCGCRREGLGGVLDCGCVLEGVSLGLLMVGVWEVKVQCSGVVECWGSETRDGGG